eukprot:Skav226262  [mRNA]  locus=scaffold2708:164460:168437:+ [translate_table: standard]
MSQVVLLPEPCSDDFSRVSEVCAGLGGTMLGAATCGFRPLVALDQSTLSCQLLRLNRFPVVVQGDLRRLDTLARFHLANVQYRCGLLSGFPCQPFGTLGQAKAFDDPRAYTFFAVLDLAWLVQAAWVLLECVVGAGQHRTIRASIDDFCTARGFKHVSTILRLDHAMPCYRTRWWCLMYPAWMPDIDINDLPVGEGRQCLADVFPFWPTWSLEEELQLKLTAEELEVFGDSQFGAQLADRLLDMQGRCPTLLHSMGNALRACPCGCRGPLSWGLLRSQGLHGVLIWSHHEEVGYRFLHPAEASFLVGLPTTLDFGTDLRAALTQIGQLASPIQSHWMVSHLQQALGLLTADEVIQQHHTFMDLHLRTHLRSWKPPTSPVPVLRILFEDEPVLQVTLSDPVRVRDLLCAEASLGREVELLTLADAFGKLDVDHWIIAGELFVQPRFGSGDPWTLLDFGFHPDSPEGLDDRLMARQGALLVGLATEQVHFLSPLCLAALQAVPPELAVHLIRGAFPSPGLFGGFFLDGAHWVTLWISVHDRMLHVSWSDGLAHRFPSASMVIVMTLFRQAWGCLGIAWKHSCPIAQTSGAHCGAIAVLNFGTQLGLWPQQSEAVALRLYWALRHVQRCCGGGPSSEASVVAWLEDFLPSKGVDSSQVTARAKLAVKQLGVGRLEQAIQQKDPWRALKQLGQSLGKPFQWVTYPELQAHIAARANSKAAGQPSNRGRKQNKPKKDHMLVLSPETVALYPTTFVDDHEDVVPPITFPEVDSNARGVCVVSVDQALELQALDSSLSSDALAVVCIGEIASKPGFKQCDLRWPALYTPTKEPILVKGTLLNLGDLEVSMAKTPDAPEVSSFDTEVVRISVFRDCFDKDWNQLVRGPVKCLLSLLPALQPCPDENCSGNCKYFHAACDEEVRHPVLDVWSWRWTDTDNKQMPVDQADVFSVFVRIPHSVLLQALGLSGWHGIFLEPRPPSKQGPHPLFAVLWLPRSMELSTALSLRRQHDHVVGVARMQRKLGLRVLKRHEATVAKEVFPGKDLTVCAVEKVFEVGPLPHGLSHAQVGSLLKAWAWVAKPLRPVRSSDMGQHWDIGTACDPPAAVLPTAAGSVTVVCKKQKSVDTPQLPLVHASVKTKKHMLTQPSKSASSSGTDPWLTTDPWLPWQKTQAAKKQTSEGDGTEVIFTEDRGTGSRATKNKLDALEERLMAHVDTQLATAKPPPGLEAMDDDTTAAQAVAIAELQEQNQKFSQWFNDVGSRFQSMEGAMRSQSTQITELQNHLQQQQTTTASLQNAVDALNQSFRAELHAGLEQQTSRLEALLEASNKSRKTS